MDTGKTTLVKAITGVWADRHSEEIKRGITIRLGYADASFYHCEECGEYLTSETCAKKHKAKFLRKVSFVDCPGHENLMAVMLSGASLMNGAILLIAANEPCPMPQTVEHLAALETIGVKNIVIVQNKADLVSKEQALKNYEQIKAFVKGTIAEGAPIIPVAAHYGINISALIQAIEQKIPTPKMDEKKELKMPIARSFDVNKPGTIIDKLIGGVIGGSITQGVLRVGDEIMISPGLQIEGKYVPLHTKVASLSTGEGMLEEAKPGGLIGIGTFLDPSLTKSDRLIGCIVGKPGKLPEPKNNIIIEVHFIERLFAAQTKKIAVGELVVITYGTATVPGIVKSIRKEKAEIVLKKPICSDAGSKVAISKKIGTCWTLIGYGVMR